jgi:hypothetical protein
MGTIKKGLRVERQSDRLILDQEDVSFGSGGVFLNLTSEQYA